MIDTVEETQQLIWKKKSQIVRCYYDLREQKFIQITCTYKSCFYLTEKITPLRASPRHMGTDGLIIWRPGQANNLVPLQTDIFKLLFGLGQVWQRFSSARVKIVDNFQRNSFVYGNWVYWCHISNYSSDISLPLIGWCPGSWPPGLPLSSTLLPQMTHQLMLFKEVINVYCKNDTKRINSLRWWSADYLNVIAGGTYKNHKDLNY
jgi:hypothetical protein